MQVIDAPRSPDSVTFSIWCPISKSLADDEGGANRRRVIEGLTSDASWDQQEEQMAQEGMDFQPLLRSGFINWNHEKGPENLIGEPLDAGLKKCRQSRYGLWVKGFLYEDGSRADETWKKIQAMQKAREAGIGHRELGWSVEGGVVLRDPENRKRILKSVVRHEALTHEPVNANSYAEVSKSFGQRWVGEQVAFHPDRNQHIVFDSFEEFAKAMSTTPGIAGMGDAAPLLTGKSHFGAVTEAPTCKGKCKRYLRPRYKSMAHLVECCGVSQGEALGVLKSLLAALD